MTQLAPLLEVHEQLLNAFTVTVPVPPVMANDSLDLESDTVHGGTTGPVVDPVVVLDTDTHGGDDPPPIGTHGATST